jgi:hypothetical protein
MASLLQVWQNAVILTRKTPIQRGRIGTWVAPLDSPKCRGRRQLEAQNAKPNGGKVFLGGNEGRSEKSATF